MESFIGKRMGSTGVVRDSGYGGMIKEDLKQQLSVVTEDNVPGREARW